MTGDEQQVAPPPPPASEQRVVAPAGAPQSPGTVAFAPDVNFQPGPALPTDTTYAQLTVNPQKYRKSCVNVIQRTDFLLEEPDSECQA